MSHVTKKLAFSLEVAILLKKSIVFPNLLTCCITAFNNRMSYYDMNACLRIKKKRYRIVKNQVKISGLSFGLDIYLIIKCNFKCLLYDDTCSKYMQKLGFILGSEKLSYRLSISTSQIVRTVILLLSHRAYRAFYILNWIYRYFTEVHFTRWIGK